MHGLRVKPAMTSAVVMSDSIRHPCSARTNASRKAVHGRTVPRNQGMSPGMAVSAAPQDVRAAARLIASCVRPLACESCLNAATKERSEFSRRGRRNRQPRFPDGTAGCRGRHDREEQSAHARLCRTHSCMKISPSNSGPDLESSYTSPHHTAIRCAMSIHNAHAAAATNKSPATRVPQSWRKRLPVC